ncbi:hypothetical protein [Borrelia hermsii]|uniref:Uncharacterized protein n=2 Tax=Borrelia hermsii TaxID=140 RepID=A0AAN0X6U0_BORHE|nr:hypothetical protein [Borrelia hermsii]AMR76205.1 hypothetical protein A0V01_06360 [Borrelia hermsii]ANA44014.1 BBD18-like protein [Borrelia hermsii HS1]UPA08432.1 hypothetical protein bhDAH_001138 [Borrelia hermsii DAH]UPA08433.1 hypothetical protein bhDAH_001139 [Borrelia hermsii DAH]
MRNIKQYNARERKLPMILDYDNYMTEGNRETFFGNSQYEANYKSKVDGFIVDFFKIPKSLKNKYEVNIKCLSSPDLPFGNIAMNCINTFKLIVDIINMQTGKTYDYDEFIAKTETEKMLQYGVKVISALSRHFDESNGTNYNEGYYEWEKGWVDKKWIDYEPSALEIKEMQELNKKINQELNFRNKRRKISALQMGQMRLMKAIKKLDHDLKQENKCKCI